MSITTGLNQAIEYERGKLKNVKRQRVTISPIPHFEGQSIKKIRDKLHLSQNTFANVIGVSKKTVEAWEAGSGANRWVGFYQL
ncbi:MAG: helix-turn-helix domain-containing protein [Spirochaetales bacterium]|nr:helix-turn-helix domain-containing protein [Spirochaetales bacterium]